MRETIHQRISIRKSEYPIFQRHAAGMTHRQLDPMHDRCADWLSGATIHEARQPTTRRRFTAFNSRVWFWK